MKGIASSPGISIGKIYILKEENLEIDLENIEQEQVGLELSKFKKALNLVETELEKIKKQTEESFGSDKAEIFESHLMFLEDPEFIKNVKEEIKVNRLRAAAAVVRVINKFINLFSDVDDEYLRGRQTDIKDVGKRIIRLITDKAREIKDLPGNSVIVAKDLSPSEIAQLNREKVVAFVSSEGSRTSHTTIMARSMGIPAVVGLGDELLLKTKDDIDIIVDGITGKVIIDPDEDSIKKYIKLKKKYEGELEKLKKFRDNKVFTIDGKEIEVLANIGDLMDIEPVLKNGGDGIGLFRTEFLYMDRDELPDEEGQSKVYKNVGEKMSGKPVIIRTLDIGGDKDLPYLDLPEETNPYLGYRAIRVCLNRPDIFRPQLKAILRASNFADIRLMFPMISHLEELDMAEEILDSCKDELSNEGIDYNSNIKVGVMIETPAAVMMAPEMARKVDFFSIGTNDLIQYTLAVDRNNEEIAEIHSPYHPSVLRLIKNTVEAAHQEGIPVGICGEAAGEDLLLPFFLGVGLDKLSMSSVSILKIKKTISKWSTEEAADLVKFIIGFENSIEVKNYLDKVKK